MMSCQYYKGFTARVRYAPYMLAQYVQPSLPSSIIKENLYDRKTPLFPVS
jgi:hypothetical protein